ncbi:MAG: hypothetical protein ABR508_00210 [Candidatus Baltobacteraceae bacterium]
MHDNELRDPDKNARGNQTDPAADEEREAAQPDGEESRSELGAGE